MTYNWKFNPRPYSDVEAKELLKGVVSPETTDWHYNTHHKGYVTALNNIEKALETADRAGANGNFSPIGELKRRFTWNHAGALLHDLYWSNLGGDGDSARAADLRKALEKEFGSFDAWKAQRASTGFPAEPGDDVLRIYTTRPDTLFGATYMVIAPEHPFVADPQPGATRLAANDKRFHGNTASINDVPLAA